MTKFYKLKEDTVEFEENRFYWENRKDFFKFQNEKLSKMLGLSVDKLNKNVARKSNYVYGITKELYELINLDESIKRKMFLKNNSFLGNLEIFEFKKSKEFKEFIKEYKTFKDFEKFNRADGNFIFWSYGKMSRQSSKDFVVFKVDGEFCSDCIEKIEEIKESEFLKILSDFEMKRGN